MSKKHLRRVPPPAPSRPQPKPGTRPASNAPSPALPAADSARLAELFNAGRHPEAEQHARLLLENWPNSGFAWKVLGAALTMQGKDALPAMQRTVELLPGDAEALSNYGVTLDANGQPALAATQFRRALALRPDDAGLHVGLGNALKNGGQAAGAVDCYRRALALAPRLASAHYNLGLALSDLGQFTPAADALRQAAALQPGDANTHYTLGNTLKALGQPEAALQSFATAVRLKPDFGSALFNLGNTLESLGRLSEAAACLRQAAAVQPTLCGAHNNLGNVLKTLGQLEAAVAAYRRALEIEPDAFEAANNLANVLADLGLLDQAVAGYRRAIQLKPDAAEAHGNLGNALKVQGHVDAALASYRRALELKPDYADALGSMLFIYNYQSHLPAAPLLDEARRFGRIAAQPARPFTAWPNRPDPARRLRVGLVSGDLRGHPVGYFVESLLGAMAAAMHGQERGQAQGRAGAGAAGEIEFFVYSNAYVCDELTKRLMAHCPRWEWVHRMPDAALAQRIHADGIDILLDLSGHTAKNRLPLFCWKPAPVQASWLGYFATTGVEAIDWFITDPWMAPPGEDANFSESLLRLPESFLCFSPPDCDQPVTALPALAGGGITFGCFNNLTKMNDAVVALWARVLGAVAGSRLFLKSPQLGEASARAAVLARFAAHGIGAERLLLEGQSPRADYLAACGRLDIALDPFPYPGGTTSVEALWMGVPVLTMAGRRHLSRQGESIMRNAGLPEWIARDEDDYLARAVAFAADLQALAALRAGLRGRLQASPLCDAPRFARHFGQALRAMWVDWCGKQDGIPAIPVSG